MHDAKVVVKLDLSLHTGRKWKEMGREEKRKRKGMEEGVAAKDSCTKMSSRDHSMSNGWIGSVIHTPRLTMKPRMKPPLGHCWED